MPSTTHRILKFFVFAALAALILSGCSKMSQPPEPETLREIGFRPVNSDVPVPNIEFLSLDGTPHSLEDFRGSVVLLNFWATWCPPCRAEMPSLQRLANQLEDREFELIAINVQEKRDLVAKFLNEFDIDFPVYLDEDAQATRTIGISSLPTSILIDRNGLPVAVLTGAIEWDDKAIIAMMKTWTR